MGEEMSRYDEYVEHQLDYVEGLADGSDEKIEASKHLNNSYDRVIECQKMVSSNYQAELKAELEREKMEHEKELQQMKQEHEKEMQHKEEEMRNKEAEIKKEQNKNDKMKICVEVGKFVIGAGLFIGFEVMAHNRDMSDVIELASTHVKKNPIKILHF